jgi:hypothetical protein
MMLADIYMLDGRTDEAISIAQRRIQQTSGSDNLIAQGSLALYLLRAGRKSEAEPIISKLEKEVSSIPELLSDLTVLNYELGNREKGFAFFKRAYEAQVLPFPMVRRYPVWDKVRADREVLAILDEPPRSRPTNSTTPSPIK